MGLLVYGLNYLVGTIGSILVTIAASLVNFALNLNNQILQNKTLEIGWAITRDLANLGFVLVIILIAFATILRIETYAMKSILWKLIVAALLVNFSMVIAGVFINFSGSLTDFFIKKATGDNPMQLSLALADSLQVQKLLQSSEDESILDQVGKIIDIATFGPRSIMITISMFFVAVFTVMAAIVLAGLAWMFLLRYLWLVILLILMPLAWVAWIWPGLNDQWKKWWSNFFKWIWFAPVASFFVYLALTISTTQEIAGFENFNTDLASVKLTIKNFGGIVAQMVIVTGLLVGGLMAAESMGIAGAAATMKLATGARNAILGGTAKFVGRGTGAFLRNWRYKEPDKEGKGGGGLVARGAQKLAGVPLVGGIGAAVSRWAAPAPKAQIESYKKRYKKMADDKPSYLNYMKSLTRIGFATNPAEAAAYLEIAAEKGFLNDLKKTDKGGFENLYKKAVKGGSEKVITAKMPSAAGIGKTEEEAKKAIREAMSKVKLEDITKLMPEEFYNREDFDVSLLLSLTKPQINKLAANASPKVKEAIRSGVQMLPEPIIPKGGKPDREQQKILDLINWEKDNIAMNDWSATEENLEKQTTKIAEMEEKLTELKEKKKEKENG